MANTKTQRDNFLRRKTRVRVKISGTAERPRLSIFKSHKYMYTQLIDDTTGKTLAAFDSRKAKGKTPLERAKEVGKEIAKKALSMKIEKVVFDRSGYLYAGQIKVVAEAAREAGLKF
jgi:large subunit ribosomal protein L18